MGLPFLAELVFDEGVLAEFLRLNGEIHMEV